MPFYNKVEKTEAIEGVHSIDPPDVIELDQSNPFFSPLPEGQQLTYDADGIPDGLEDIPDPVYTPEEQAAIDLAEANINAATISSATYAERRGYPDVIDAIDDAVDQIALDNGLVAEAVVMLIV